MMELRYFKSENSDHAQLQYRHIQGYKEVDGEMVAIPCEQYPEWKYVDMVCEIFPQDMQKVKLK